MSTMNQVGVGLSGASGTGSFAGTNSPTFVTPALGAATGTSLVVSGALTATAGIVTSGAGTGGFIGQFQAFSTTSSLGSVSLTAANNAGNFANVLTNASTAAARTWTLPDATGTIALTGSSSSGYVLLSPAADQHILNAHNLYVDQGAVISGLTTGGFSGNFVAFPTTAAKGLLQIVVADNAGNFGIVVTNASFGQASTLTIPDPGASTSTFALNTGSLTSGHLVSYNGTTGLLQDSGIASSAVATTSTAVLLSPAGNQAITSGFLTISGGVLVLGTSTGAGGSVTAYSPTSGKGNFEFNAADNAGAFNVAVTNASMGQSTTFTIPDPGASTATFILNKGTQSIGAGLSLTTPNIGAATATSINFGGSTLSTYVANGTFTPVFTFGTPGDLSVVYTNQVGFYTQIGGIVFYKVAISFTPTFTTSAGVPTITGLPVAANATASTSANGVAITGTLPTWPAGTTQIFCNVQPSATQISFSGEGTGVGTAAFSTTNFTTTLASTLSATGWYFV